MTEPESNSAFPFKPTSGSVAALPRRARAAAAVTAPLLLPAHRQRLGRRRPDAGRAAARVRPARQDRRRSREPARVFHPHRDASVDRPTARGARASRVAVERRRPTKTQRRLPPKQRVELQTSRERAAEAPAAARTRRRADARSARSVGEGVGRAAADDRRRRQSRAASRSREAAGGRRQRGHRAGAAARPGRSVSARAVRARHGDDAGRSASSDLSVELVGGARIDNFEDSKTFFGHAHMVFPPEYARTSRASMVIGTNPHWRTVDYRGERIVIGFRTFDGVDGLNEVHRIDELDGKDRAHPLLLLFAGYARDGRRRPRRPGVAQALSQPVMRRADQVDANRAMRPTSLAVRHSR